MVEGLGQPTWAPAAPKVEQERVDSYSEPSMESLGIGLSGTGVVAFGLLSDFSERNNNLSKADFRFVSFPKLWQCCQYLFLNQ